MLGRHIHAAMQAAGWRVVCCGRNRPNWIDCEDWVEWNLADRVTKNDLDRWLADVDVVIHAGASVPRAGQTLSETDMLDANVRACNSICAWGLGKNVPMVYISGAIVYADPERSGITEDMPLGRNRLGGFYGLTKMLAEEIVGYYRDQGLKGAVLRPSSIYGAGMPESKMVAGFIGKAVRGETIQLLPPIDDRIDLIHASDVAEAVRLAIDSGWNGVANLASGKTVSVIELASECVSVAGAGRVEIYGCRELNSKAPIIRFGLDTKTARQYLGWEAKVGLRRGLEQLAAITLAAI